MSNNILIFLTLVSFISCRTPKKTEDASIWQKIQINFRQIDADGLRGPASGKVAVNYEFCVPRNEKNWKTVSKIDKTAKRYETGKGRIACKDDQWLVVGTTHQKNYQRVLYDLASLPYVNRIEEVFWE